MVKAPLTPLTPACAVPTTIIPLVLRSLIPEVKLTLPPVLSSMSELLWADMSPATICTLPPILPSALPL